MILACAIKLRDKVFSLPAPNTHTNVLEHMRIDLGYVLRGQATELGYIAMVNDTPMFVDSTRAADIALYNSQITTPATSLIDAMIWANTQ